MTWPYTFQTRGSDSELCLFYGKVWDGLQRYCQENLAPFVDKINLHLKISPHLWFTLVTSIGKKIHMCSEESRWELLGAGEVSTLCIHGHWFYPRQWKQPLRLCLKGSNMIVALILVCSFELQLAYLQAVGVKVDRTVFLCNSWTGGQKPPGNPRYHQSPLPCFTGRGVPGKKTEEKERLEENNWNLADFSPI